VNQAARRNLTDDQRAAYADEVAKDEEELSKRERAKKAGEAGRGRPKVEDDSLHTDVVCELSSSGSLTADQKAIIASDPAPEQAKKKAARKEWAVPRATKAARVSERTVRDWLSRIDKDAKEARNRRIFNLWLACWTQDLIAEEVGCTRDKGREVKQLKLGESTNLAEFPKTVHAAAEQARHFDPPLYNIWKQQEKTKGPGRRLSAGGDACRYPKERQDAEVWFFWWNHTHPA